MGWELVGQGTDIGELPGLEDQLEEQDRCELSLNLSVRPPDFVVDALQEGLEIAGVPLWDRVRAEGNSLKIRFTKGFPWLAIIAAVILGLIALAILLVSWGLWRDVAGVVPEPILGALVLAVLVLIALNLWKKR